jgi:hypothetical protein
VFQSFVSLRVIGGKSVINRKEHGIMKKQPWCLLALMLAIPIALNIFGMYRDEGDLFTEAVTTGKIVRHWYRDVVDPWPETLKAFLGVTGHLGLLAWFGRGP